MKKNAATGVRKAVRIFWRIFFGCFAAFAILILMANFGVFGKMPTLEDLENPSILQASEVYAEDGTLMGKYYTERGNRSNVKYRDISKHVIDALVATAGIAYFGPFDKMTETDFRVGLDSKLMGQINLVMVGQNYINPKGSITLTSGTLSDDPVRMGAAISSVNGAINSFVKAASVELSNGIRINAVAPGVAEDSPEFHPYFPGMVPDSMNRLSMAYIKSVLGAQTGQVFKAQ